MLSYINWSGISAIIIIYEVSSVIAVILFLLWSGFGTASAYTVLMAVLSGIITTVQAVSGFSAFAIGPMSYTTVIISFSTLISALPGVMPSAMFFPIVNGGGLVLSTLAARAVKYKALRIIVAFILDYTVVLCYNRFAT